MAKPDHALGQVDFGQCVVLQPLSSTILKRDRVKSNKQARATLEAVALEGYRSDRLSEADSRELLGFETRMEVHEFLKEHGVFLHYTDEDLAHDREVAIQVARRVREERPGDPSDQRRLG